LGDSNCIPLLEGDWDGDGIADPVAFDTNSGTWYVTLSIDGGTRSFGFGANGDIPLLGRMQGGTQPDAVYFHPVDGTWHVRFGSETNVFQFGTNGDIPLLRGDFDGDGIDDAVIFRPSTSTWYIRSSATGLLLTNFVYGTNGDIPLLSDNGRKAPNITVFRPSNGTWYTRLASDGSTRTFQWGTNGDIPWSGYITPDGSMDQIVYRPSTGVYYVRDSAGQGTNSFQSSATSTDIPVH
jgi:hypothetical protein